MRFVPFISVTHADWSGGGCEADFCVPGLQRCSVCPVGTRPGLGVGLEGVKGLEGPYEEWLRALGWFHLGETIWGL